MANKNHKKKFIFTEKLAYELVMLPQDWKYAGFAYAMNYGLGRTAASDEELFDPLTREIDRANREAANCSAEDVREIVDCLNEVCGTKFRATSEKTRKLINTRFGEEYTVEDFKLVIRHRHQEWAGTRQAEYLRPETLFGPKFEGYLQAARRAESDGKMSSFDTDRFFDAAVERSYGGWDGTC